MKRKLAWFLLCTMVCVLGILPQGFAAAVPQAATLTTQSTGIDGMIRVWLSSIKSNTTYDITVQGSYRLGDRALSSGEKVKIEFSDGNVYATVGGFRMSMGTSATLTRESGGVKIAQSLASANAYPGNLQFFYTNGTAYVICTLHIEDYVQGVLPYEMDNGFPLEALKAQAIAARTYGMHAKKSSGTYDVTDTTSHQVYRGTNTSKTRCIQAAEETAGVVMMSGGSYIEANFGASNGGQTETRTNAWGSAAAPYQVIQDDPYDLRNTRSVAKSYLIHQTDRTASVSAYTMIQNALVKKLGGTAAQYTVSEVTAVEAHTPKFAAPSKLYTKLAVTVRYNDTAVETVDIDIFPTVKESLGLSINSTSNELFTVEKEANGFRVTARRYGHGIGMSQRGAQQMAEEGLGFLEIIGFYYPNVDLIKRNFTSNWSSGGSASTPAPGGATAAPTAAPEGEKQGAVRLSNPNNRLNLRQTPSLTGSVLARLPHGATVTIIGTMSNWYHVQYGGLVGYVSSEYIQVQQAVTPGEGGAYVTLQSGRLNVRTEGRATAGILGSIPNGAYVTVLSDGAAWTKVQYEDLTGFVMTKYLQGDGMGLVQPPSGTETQAAVSLANPRETLNLRLNPSTNSAVLKRLNHGTVLAVLEKGSAWTKVSVSGQIGYVMNTYITFSDAAAPTATPTAAPGQTEAPVQVWPGRVSVASGKLNLRSEPNINADVLTGIPNQEAVTITQVGNIWCAVTYESYTGYAMRKYLTITEDAQWVVPTEIPAQPSPTATPVPSATPAPKAMWVKTNTKGNINIREAPSMNSKVAGAVPYGGQVTVEFIDGDWAYGAYGHIKGYMSKAYLVDENPIAGTAEGLGEVYRYVRTSKGGPVNLRAYGYLEARSLASIPHGSKVILLTEDEEWSYVRFNGLEGFIATMYLTASAPVLDGDDTQTSGPTATPTKRPEDVVNTAHVDSDEGIESIGVYDEASTSAVIIGALQYNDEVEILGYSGSKAQWVYLRKGDLTGYAPRTDFTLEYTVAVVELQNLHSKLNVRQAASESSALVTEVSPGALVTVLYAHDSGWAEIRLEDGTTGFASSAYLNLLE